MRKKKKTSDILIDIQLILAIVALAFAIYALIEQHRISEKIKKHQSIERRN